MTAQRAAATEWRQIRGERFSELTDISQPTLVVNGHHDVMIPTINSYTLSQHLPRAQTSDPVVGGRFRVVMKGWGRELTHIGEYLVIERPTRLVFTWQSEPAGDTLVAVEFTRVTDQRTLVTLTHERFPTGEQRDLHRDGWTALLETLAGVITEMEAR